MIVPLLAMVLLQDPAAVLRDARSAQEAFEHTRRVNLPRTNAAGGAQRCDERIGRFCYWYDPRERLPPYEGSVIISARETLLARLAQAAEVLPGDPWLLGQRVRYLLEASRGPEAQAVVEGCAVRSAWCAALSGLVLHTAGETAAADSAFSSALRLAAPEERCRWLDLGLLLPQPDRKAWQRLSCGERTKAAERWLELGRPLLARAGNGVRTEFLSRQVMVRIVQKTVTPYGMRFRDDDREMVLRYGWPLGWSQVLASGIGESYQVIGHDPSPAIGFLPTSATDPAWELEAERPRARFKARGVDGMRDLTRAQLARLPRAGGTLVVGAWELAPADLLNTPGITGVLAVKVRGRPPSVALQIEDGRQGFVAAMAPPGVEAAGLELLAPDGATWARFRSEWNMPLPATGPVLSDLLLFDPAVGAPDELSGVLMLALRGHAIAQGGKVGVYWEWDRLPAGVDSVGTTLAISRKSGGAPVLAWSWPGRTPPPRQGTGVTVLDLGRLGKGEYYLDVVLTVAGQALRSRRLLQIT